MSATKDLLAFPTESSLCYTTDTQSLLDKEMTGLLTFDGNSNTRSCSSSPFQGKMSSSNSTRERNDQVNLVRCPPMGNRQGISSDGDQTGQGFSRDNAPSPPNQLRQEYSSNLPLMGNFGGNGYGGPAGARARGNSGIMGESSIPLSTVIPGNVSPTENQLNVSYSYAIRRFDGSVTRLIPADELNSGYVSRNMPSYQGAEGLIILPAPRQVSPSRRQGPEIMIPTHVVRNLQAVPDPTQTRIDNIVNHNNVNQHPQRREKVYCDKWIHEGVCAFTQMGCKYKQATQVDLGLSHGLPAWYRRAYAVNLSPALSRSATSAFSSNVSPPGNMRLLENNWRHGQDSTPRNNAMVGMNFGGSNVNRGGSIQTSFGPIGPPPNQPHFGSLGTNIAYSTMKVEERDVVEEEDDEDELTYHGRHGQQKH